MGLWRIGRLPQGHPRNLKSTQKWKPGLLTSAQWSASLATRRLWAFTDILTPPLPWDCSDLPEAEKIWVRSKSCKYDCFRRGKCGLLPGLWGGGEGWGKGPAPSGHHGLHLERPAWQGKRAGQSQVTTANTAPSPSSPNPTAGKHCQKEAKDGFHNLLDSFLIHVLAYLRALPSSLYICLPYCSFPFPRYKCPYVKQISNKDLLYNIGNYTQYLVVTFNGI